MIGEMDDAARPETAPGEGPPTLDAAHLTVRRAPSGGLHLTDAAVTHLRVTCYRAFPLTDAEEWIVFFDGQGAHLGVLPAIADLDPESQAACREELELRYLVPRVVEVVSVREESGENHWRPAQVWDVRTNRGVFRLHLPNVTDHVRGVADGSLLFSDRDGRRCILRDADLDAASRALVRRYLWGGDL